MPAADQTVTQKRFIITSLSLLTAATHSFVQTLLAAFLVHTGKAVVSEFEPTLLLLETNVQVEPLLVAAADQPHTTFLIGTGIAPVRSGLNINHISKLSLTVTSTRLLSSGDPGLSFVESPVQ